MCLEEKEVIKNSGWWELPAARSLYRTPLFSAAMGCRTMLLMMPRKMTDAYRAPKTLVIPIWVVTWPPSFQKINLQST